MVTNNSCDYSPTQYDVLTGGSNGTINNVSPSSTSGVPLISQGSSSQPAFGTAVVAGGGTGITSGTAYGVVCAGTTSTGNFQVVTPGTSTYVLTSGGSSALPTWQANSATGNLVLIQSQSVATSTATISFTTGITNTYNTYVFYLSNISSTTGIPSILMNFSTNGGSSYVASNYSGGQTYNGINGAATWSNVNSTTAMLLGGINTNTGSNATQITCTNIRNGDQSMFYGFTFGNGYWSALGTYNTGTTAINAFQFSLTSNDFATATISLYGLVE